MSCSLVFISRPERVADAALRVVDSAKAPMHTEILGAALLWLRNHYDLDDGDKVKKQRVIDRIDRVLLKYGPTYYGQAKFRESFPDPG